MANVLAKVAWPDWLRAGLADAEEQAIRDLLHAANASENAAKVAHYRKQYLQLLGERRAPGPGPSDCQEPE